MKMTKPLKTLKDWDKILSDYDDREEEGNSTEWDPLRRGKTDEKRGVELEEAAEALMRTKVTKTQDPSTDDTTTDLAQMYSEGSCSSDAASKSASPSPPTAAAGSSPSSSSSSSTICIE